MIQNFPDGWSVVVVGDLKTPHNDWFGVNRKNLFYLHPERQAELFPELSGKLGFGTYARKNIGYLFAIMNGATAIWDTDDDTYFRREARLALTNLEACKKTLLSGDGYFNPYLFFAKNSRLWPRGYPLKWVAKNRDVISENFKFHDLADSKPFDILQTLVNIEPDVDAIYRMTVGDESLDFPFSSELLILDKGVVSPGNTQSTFWVNREKFNLLYIPRWVTFRFCDILKMYVAQSSSQLAYGGFWSEQYRNPHDYMIDFESEIQCYLNTEKVVEYLSTNQSTSIAEVYAGLLKIGICIEQEVEAASIFESLVNEFTS